MSFLNKKVGLLLSEILYHPSDSLSVCFPRPGVHEVQQLSSGARHAALFTGKSLPPASLHPLLPLLI